MIILIQLFGGLALPADHNNVDEPGLFNADSRAAEGLYKLNAKATGQLLSLETKSCTEGRESKRLPVGWGGN
jgi:hypothetical protein